MPKCEHCQQNQKNLYKMDGVLQNGQPSVVHLCNECSYKFIQGKEWFHSSQGLIRNQSSQPISVNASTGEGGNVGDVDHYKKSGALLDTAYNNVGKKIKSWAKWFLISEMIAVVVGVLFTILPGNEDLIIELFEEHLFALIFGVFGVLGFTWLLYGFGELIDKASATEQPISVNAPTGDGSSVGNVAHYKTSGALLDTAYNNVGKKIKSWAKWIFIIEIIAAVVGVFFTILSDDGDLIIELFEEHLPVLILGVFGVLGFTWLLYGFGELIDKASATEQHARKLNETAEEIKNLLISMQNDKK